MFEIEEWQIVSRQEDELVDSLFGDPSVKRGGKKTKKQRKKKIPSDGTAKYSKNNASQRIEESGSKDRNPSKKKAKKRKLAQELRGCERNGKAKKIGRGIDVPSDEGEGKFDVVDHLKSAKKDRSGGESNKMQGKVAEADLKCNKTKIPKKKKPKKRAEERTRVLEQVPTDHGEHRGEDTLINEFHLNQTGTNQLAVAEKGRPLRAGQTVLKPDLVSSSKSVFRAKMMKKLESSRFRWINERLYTTKGDEAMDMFSSDPSLFSVYHRGFKAQVQQWPVNPVDVIIKWLQERPSSLVVADFGCGEAAIAQRIPNKVHSFDLVAVNEHVTACDMSKVPLPKSSVDVAVFCLSLMGTNLVDFLQEAHRVLRKGGTLKIAEVVSRIEENDAFVSSLSKLGFQCQEIDTSNNIFVLFEFLKSGSTMKSPKARLKGLNLKPCIYKRR